MSATLIFFVLSSLFYFFSYPGVNNDLWGHLFFGREIWQGGKLPPQNLYSYTAPDYRWINHEWLAEVIFYGLFHLFGSPGLILLSACRETSVEFSRIFQNLVEIKLRVL